MINNLTFCIKLFAIYLYGTVHDTHWFEANMCPLVGAIGPAITRVNTKKLE